jgi:septal ring factor EnvC (AmiA/AmiB activator)
MKALPSILLTIMLAFCVFIYIKYSHVAKYQNQLINQAEMQSDKIESLNEKLSNITQEKDQLTNHVIEIESENKKLKLTPIKIITKTINNNEKITPVSNYSSQYYNRFLSKRYENK